MFQGVHETICFGPAATGWEAGEAPVNQIVFIGRDLDRRVRCWLASRRPACHACLPRACLPAGLDACVHMPARLPPLPACLPGAAPLPALTPPPHTTLVHEQALAEGLRSCVWLPLPEGWSEHVDGRTGTPYYVNAATGAKQWERPDDAVACALVLATETSHQQPSGMRPRRSAEAEAVQA